MSLAAGVSDDFLTDNDIEALAALTVFPDSFADVAGYGDVNFGGRFKYPYASAGSTLAIAPEDLLEIAGGTLEEMADRIPITISGVLPWAPRGSSVVPIFANFAVVLFEVQVPQGYKMWLEGAAFGLFPSQANELNYQWQITVNGQDVLNSTLGPQVGRPTQSAEKFQLGFNKDSKLLAQPGSIIRLTVLALATLAASDSVSGTVFGSLEPMSL